VQPLARGLNHRKRADPKAKAYERIRREEVVISRAMDGAYMPVSPV
jgi:hypothetical protein